MSFIPANRRRPLTAININNEFAVQGDSLQPYRVLFIGPKGTGNAVVGQVTKINSLGDAATKLGRGSAAYDFAKGFFAQKSGHELNVLVVDDASLTARVATLTFGGVATEAKTLALYVGGLRVAVNVDSGATAAQVATNVASALNAQTELAFTAVATGAVVALTSRNKGLFTNDIMVENSRGEGEALPAGITLAKAETTPGAGVPTTLPLSAVDANTQYILLSTCFNDAATLGLIKTELENRNDPTRKVDGYNISAKYGNSAELTALGTMFNSQFISIFPAVGGSTESYLSGAIVGQTARVKANDPAASVRGVELLGAAQALNSEVLSDSQLNTLLLNGVSSYNVSLGKVRLDLLATTYRTDSDGQTDVSYFDLSVLLVLSYLRYDLDRLSAQRFAGAKIGRDGVNYDENQKIVTEKSIEAEIINIFDSWEERGLIEDRAAFRRSLSVMRNASDVNRVDIVLRPNVVNELRILGYDIQFIL